MMDGIGTLDGQAAKVKNWDTLRRKPVMDGIGVLDEEQTVKVKCWDLATGKTATMINTENTQTLQLAAYGDRLVLLGDEIPALASVIRMNDGDTVKSFVDPLLKDCPFCGGRPRMMVLRWRDGGKGEPAACRVQCSVCGARTADIDDKTDADIEARGDGDARRQAKERWNQRA